MHLAVLLFSLVLAGTWSVAVAHGDNVATIKISRQPSNNWIFELHTPLHGLDEAMREINKERAPELAELDQNSVEYKELIVDYVKSEFALEQVGADNNATAKSASSLGRGRLRLGEHASVLMFEITNMPDESEEVTLHLPYMENIAGQANVLWLVDGDRSERYVLTADNKFTASDVDFFTGIAKSVPQTIMLDKPQSSQD